MKGCICVLAILFAVCLTGTGDATVITADTFTTGDGTGTNGGSVNGQLTEVGGVAWSGRNNWEYSAGTLVTDVAGAAGGANTRILSVPVSIGGPVSLSADLIAPTTINPLDWSAVGFSKNSAASADSGFYSAGVGQLWLALRKNGTFFMTAGSSTTLADAATPLFNSTGFNHVELIFNPAANTASALINGVPVVTAFNLSTVGITPSINEAGFHLFRFDLAAADNFLLATVEIPEPVGISSLSVVLAYLGLKRTRRKV